MLYETTFITAYSAALTAIIGACMGSFLNCISWRIVHGESAINGRSHCDLCGHVLGVGDLIPVLSYLLHGGRCKYCGQKLSGVHVLAELISALAFVTILLKFNISLQALKYMLMASVLLAASFADLEGRIIPDRFLVFGILVYLGFLPFDENPLGELADGALGAVVVAGFVLACVMAFEKIKNIEAMGGGDIKLLFVTGLYLGLAANIICLILACFLGIFFGLAFAKIKGEKEFPWGPSIAMAAWISLLCGNEFANWYLSLL